MDGDPFTSRCSASPPRAPSSRPPTPPRVAAAAQRAGVPVTVLGTTGGDVLAVEGLPDLPLAELRAAWTATLPALFGTPEVTVGTVPAGTVPTS